jgi:hypothetical protein
MAMIEFEDHSEENQKAVLRYLSGKPEPHASLPQMLAATLCLVAADAVLVIDIALTLFLVAKYLR